MERFCGVFVFDDVLNWVDSGLDVEIYLFGFDSFVKLIDVADLESLQGVILDIQ